MHIERAQRSERSDTHTRSLEVNVALCIATCNKAAYALAVERESLVSRFVVPRANIAHVVHTAHDVLRVRVRYASSLYLVASLHALTVKDCRLTDRDYRVQPHCHCEVKVHGHLLC